MLTKEEIQGLRDLPPDYVRDALKNAGVPLHEPRRTPRNGLDVAMFEAGWEFNDAVERLAVFFPDAIRAGAETGLTTFEEAEAEARRRANAAGEAYREYKKTDFGSQFRMDVFRWFRGLQLDRIDIHTSVSQEARDRAAKRKDFIPRLKLEDATIYDVFRKTPTIMKIGAAGQTKTAPVTVYCAPKWADGKIGIMIEDLGKPALDPERPDDYEAAIKMGAEFLEKCPPSAIVDTSDRLPQVFYILERKYPEQEFYNAFVKKLNAEFGDCQVTRQGWDTRLAGLYNQKSFMRDGSGRTPKCRLRSASTRYPVEMERMIEEFRPVWEQEQREKPKVSAPAPASHAPAGTASVSALEMSGEAYSYKAFDALKAQLEEAYAEGGLKGAMQVLEEVPIPDYIYKTGQACEKDRVNYWMDVNGAVDRSAVDAETARVLYHLGATPHEVYSYLLHYACQDEQIVMREHGPRQRVKNPADKDYKARRTALNLAPDLLFPHSWRTENPDNYSRLDLARKVGHEDEEYQRRFLILNPPRIVQRRRISFAPRR